MSLTSIASAKDERREWRLLWLGSIQAFADSHTQAKPSFSFSDCMSAYFDEANLREENAYQRRLSAMQITAAEIAAVADFHSLARCYECPNDDNLDTRAILSDPNWQKLVASACKATERLLLLLSDTSEREALARPGYGFEQANIFPSPQTGPSVVAEQQVLDSRLGAFVRGSLVLTKPMSVATAKIPTYVRRQLVPLGFHAENDKAGATYTIGYFAMSRAGSSDPHSMFAAFKEVRLVQRVPRQHQWHRFEVVI